MRRSALRKLAAAVVSRLLRYRRRNRAALKVSLPVFAVLVAPAAKDLEVQRLRAERELGLEASRAGVEREGMGNGPFLDALVLISDRAPGARRAQSPARAARYASQYSSPKIGSGSGTRIEPCRNSLRSLPWRSL